MDRNMDDVSRRLSHTHSGMLYQEKFDTWLNLQPLKEMVGIAKQLSEWPGKPIYKENIQIIGYRSLDGLRSAKVSPNRVSKAKVSPLLPSLFIRDILCDRCPVLSSVKRNIKQMLTVSGKAAAISAGAQTKHLLSSVEVLGQQWGETSNSVYKKKLDNLPNEVIISTCVYEDMLNIMNIHKTLSGSIRKTNDYKDHETITVKSLQSSVVITADLFIWRYDNVDFLLHRSGFLEVFNKISEIHALLLYAWMQTSTSMSDSHYRDCIRFWRHIARKVSSFYLPTQPLAISEENKGFAYTKSIEGLGVSELIRRGDETWGWTNERLGQVLWNALKDDNIVSEREFKYSEFFILLRDMSEETIAELLGTVKVVGHPSIEVEAGLDSLYEKTHANLPINLETRNACVGILTRDIIRVFYNKYKRYPKVKFEPGTHPNLISLISTARPWNSPEGQSLIDSVTPSDWYKVRFDKNDEFEAMDNRLALLKDKSLGLQRSVVMQNWISNVRTQKNVINSKAILHFLFSDEVMLSLTDYMKKFGDEEWEESLYDYLVIKLTAKELELKSKGRFFGASPSVERDRRVVTESNVMRLMSQVIPDQLLTPNELEVLKKLVSFRDYRAIYPNCHIINISFDFSSWNNSMRSEVVDVGAGRILDSWYGTTYYSKTMKAYENMLIYYDDGLIKRKWDGQYGGIEGLNQATWSIVFIGGIKYALESLGHRYSITVKGDDVRAAIIVPKSSVPLEEVEMFRDQIMSSIQKLCKDMGWSLNPNESFVSLSLIATSKQYLFNDTWLPASMKKIMKITSHTNGVFVSLEDIISTVFSIAHSSCSQTTVVLPAFYTASLVSACIFYRQLNRNIRNQQVIAALLVWPQILSGPGPLPLQTFFVRGENDMLSVIIALYRHILVNHEDTYFKALIKNIMSIKLSQNPSGKMLLGDPYCLDLESPDRPESILKRELKKILAIRVVHPEIKALLSQHSNLMAEKIVQCLIAARPYYAKVSTAIWECTPFYLIEELLAKFTHSSTIMGFFTQMRSLNTMSRLGAVMWRKIIQAAKKRFNFWEATLLPRYDDLTIIWGLHLPDWRHRCPTEIAKLVRNNQWGDVRGLTYPSLATQNIVIPERNIRQYRFSYGHLPRGAYSTVQIFHSSCSYQTPSKSHHYASHKSSKIWLGARTSTKAEYVDIPESTQSPVLRKVKLLLALRKSSKTLGQTILPLIDKLLESYTTIPIQDLELLTPIDSIEHFAHRVPINSFSMTTMPNCRPNIAQLCLVNNESFTLLNEDPVNRSINMAARQFYLVAGCTFPLQYSNHLPLDHPESFLATLHHDISNVYNYDLCPDCCANVNDERVTFPDLAYLDLSSYRRLPLVACGEFESRALLSAIKNLKLGVNLVLQAPKLDDIQPDVRTMQCLRILVSQHIHVSLDTYHTILREGIHVDQATSSMVDNVLLSEGKKSLSNALASLNIWRSVNSRMLYEAILIEAYIIFLTRAVSLFQFDGTFNNDGYIPEVCSTALTIIFSRIAQVQGLAFINDGLLKCGYVKREITWGFYLDRLQVLSKSFYLTHWSQFKTWFASPESCPFHYSMALFNSDESLCQSLESKFGYVMTLFIALLRKQYRMSWMKLSDWINQPMERVQADPRTRDLLAKFRWIIRIGYLAETLVYKPWRSPEYKPEEFLDPQGCINIFAGDGIYDMEEIEELTTSIQLSPVGELPYHLTTMIIWNHLKVKIVTSGGTGLDVLESMFKFSLSDIASPLPTLIEEAMDMINTFSRTYKMVVNIQVVRGSLVECERVVKEHVNKETEDTTEGPIVMRLPSHQRLREEEPLSDISMLSFLCKRPHASGLTHKVINHQSEGNGDMQYTQLMNLTQEWTRLLKEPRTHLTLDGTDFFRIFGNLNKAYLRWVEVMVKTGLPWSHHLRNSVILVLGDGGGSVSRFLVTTYQQIKIIFCDKVVATGPGSIANGTEAPAEFLSNTKIEYKKLITWDGFTTGDVSEVSTRENIQMRLEESRLPCRLVISDIVPDNLKISHDDMSKIVYGILDAGFHALSNGGVLMFRLPLLDNIRWSHFLCIIYESFSHVHIFMSDFDRPELLSIYVVIFISHNPIHYSPNLSTKLFDPSYKPNLDIWDYNDITKTIRRLIRHKITIRNQDIMSPYCPLNSNWDNVVKSQPIAPISSLTMDWTNEFTMKETHLCRLPTEYVMNCNHVGNIRRTQLLRMVVERNTNCPQDVISQTIKEMIVSESLSSLLTSAARGDNLSVSQIKQTIRSIWGEHNQLLSRVQELYPSYSNLLSVYYKQVITTREVMKHYIRFISWWVLSYKARTMACEESHPWFDSSVDQNLCDTCHYLSSQYPAPPSWRSRNGPDIYYFLWT